MKIFPRLLSVLAFFLTMLALTLAVAPAGASGFKTLYSFTGDVEGPGNGDGGCPVGPLVRDRFGNLYGTADGGGAGFCFSTWGTVFRLTPQGAFSVLHGFRDKGDGDGPEGGLVADGAGNYYGTASFGGRANLCAPLLCGVIFKVTPEGDFTVVDRLKGGFKGEYPVGPVLIGADGKLYVTTLEGGFMDHGVLLDLPPTGGPETLLHKFGHVTTTGADGHYPSGRLVQDSTGNIYGTTQESGLNNGGVVFRYGADGSYSIVHAFGAGSSIPSGLLLDASDNLYGATRYGGTAPCKCGTIYKIAPDGTTTILYSFGTTVNDGIEPFDIDLIEDPAGNLYGTTPYGGGPGCDVDNLNCGTVFEISPSGVETILHRFTGTDGGAPRAGLLLFKNHLYGTTTGGGTHNAGTIFRLDLPKT